jgi:hypothetical protein
MPVFTIAIRIKGEWHTIATTPARIWADDIADGLIAADIRHEVQISEDGQVVATITKEV